MKSKNDISAQKSNYLCSHESRVFMNLKPSVNKLSKRSQRVQYIMLFLGWILGVVACIYLSKGYQSFSRIEHYIVSIIASAGGLASMHKLVIPIITNDSKHIAYPLGGWWSLCVGILAGIAGGLLSMILTDPVQFIKEIFEISVP